MVTARWPDSPTGVLETWLKKWRSDAASFMRTGTRGSPSWPGRCPQAGYVDADCLDQIAKTACGRGGPYVFKRRLGRGVLPGMVGARLQPGQPERVQPLADRTHMHRHVEATRNFLLQVHAAPARHTMDRGIGTGDDQCPQLRHLRRAQDRRRITPAGPPSSPVAVRSESPMVGARGIFR